MKIHGGVWFAIGILIWAYAGFIASKTGSKVGIFTWFAIICVIWGAIRLTQDHVVKKSPREEVGPPAQRQHPQAGHGSPHQSHAHIRDPHGSPHQTHTHTRPHVHSSHHVEYRRCPHCHHPVPNRLHHCPFCRNNI